MNGVKGKMLGLKALLNNFIMQNQNQSVYFSTLNISYYSPQNDILTEQTQEQSKLNSKKRSLSKICNGKLDQLQMQLTKLTKTMPKGGHKPDKYEGGLDPQTKLRQGHGVYHYDNQFFIYEGQYEQGKKQGKGILKFKDGTTIDGTFEAGELHGPAEITYSHGAIYKGNLSWGEKTGQGQFKSMFEKYSGQWKDNLKHGQGTYKNLSTNQEYIGAFQKDKPHGKGKQTKWNYSYEGMYEKGCKQGQGHEVNDWRRQEGKEGVGKYQYSGNFAQDQFQGEGTYESRQSKYVYKGTFSKGLPQLYPNQYRLYFSNNTRNGEEITQGAKTLCDKAQPLEYELQGDPLNLYIETVYQGPEELDPVQPTPEQIEGMIKNWQNENKKNKNPPPMPDFNKPKMKKPQLIIVSQQTGRSICLSLLRQVEGKQEAMKIDYRFDIQNKRKQNEEIRLEALKKAEQDGGKKGGKKDNKGQPELKVNIFNANPSKKEKTISILTEEGKAELKGFELPDDFPPGKYTLQINSPFVDFGSVQTLRKEFNIKAKVPAKKK